MLLTLGHSAKNMLTIMLHVRGGFVHVREGFVHAAEIGRNRVDDASDSLRQKVEQRRLLFCTVDYKAPLLGCT